MKIAIIRLVESISILKHCNLNEKQKTECRLRVEDAFNSLDSFKVPFKIQNQIIALGEREDIRKVGYDELDKKALAILAKQHKKINKNGWTLRKSRKSEEKMKKVHNIKEQEMREEARAAIIEALEDGYSGYYCDLHNEVFNTDYYIIGTHQAKEALCEYDVFEALEKVQTYEKNNFGEIYTDLSDPEGLINVLYYIIGEEVLFEMMDGIEAWDDNWNNQADEETNAAILEETSE